MNKKTICYLLSIPIALSNYVLCMDPNQPSTKTLAQAALFSYCCNEQNVKDTSLPGKHGLGDYALVRFTNDQKDSNPVGFQAIALKHKKNNSVICAFRGTEPSDLRTLVTDSGILLAAGTSQDPYKEIWKHLGEFLKKYNTKEYDAYIAVNAVFKLRKLSSYKQKIEHLLSNFGEKIALPEISKQSLAETNQRARAFAQEICSSNPQKITIVGHSSGGFIAQLVGEDLQLQTTTFNAPGALSCAPNQVKKIRSQSLVNYVRDNDVVGRFGTGHLGTVVTWPNFNEGPAIAKKTTIYWQQEQEKDYNSKSGDTPLSCKYVKKIDGKLIFNTAQYVKDHTSFTQYVLNNHSMAGIVEDLIINPSMK